MDEIEKYQELFGEVCTLIEGSRYRLATAVNAEVCLLHWNVGSRIKTEILNNQRAAYGKEVMKNLAVSLTEKYGKGWGYEKLKHCVRSAYPFLEDEIVYAVRTQLKWTYLRSLMSIIY